MNRDDAMHVAATEYKRFVECLRTLADDDWRRPTDCPKWDVRAMVAHVCGAVEAMASPDENQHQQEAAAQRPEPFVDAIGEVQIGDRAGVTPAALIDRIERAAQPSIANRRQLPDAAREHILDVELPFGQVELSIGFLHDVVYTRDTWMHRVDITRATNHKMTLTPDHDGVLVADVVDDWGRRHGKAFSLTLTGPAGGHFSVGSGGEEYTLDAVEFCRVVSGRATGAGLLETEVVF